MADIFNVFPKHWHFSGDLQNIGGYTEKIKYNQVETPSKRRAHRYFSGSYDSLTVFSFIFENYPFNNLNEITQQIYYVQ